MVTHPRELQSVPPQFEPWVPRHPLWLFVAAAGANIGHQAVQLMGFSSCWPNDSEHDRVCSAFTDGFRLRVIVRLRFRGMLLNQLWFKLRIRGRLRLRGRIIRLLFKQFIIKYKLGFRVAPGSLLAKRIVSLGSSCDLTAHRVCMALPSIAIGYV